jgi:hypothetical protein
VCDVLFELPSVVPGEDDSLRYYLNELQIKKKILFGVPGTTSENIGISPHFPNIQPKYTGSTNIQPVSGLFVRQQIAYDNANIFDRKYLDREGIYDDQMMIIDLGQITRDKDASYLSALLPEKTPIKKIIFLGAIRGDHLDKHPTYYGDLDGAIILLNTYLGLVQEQNKFNIWLWIVSFVFFSIIAYRVILGKEKELPPKSSLWKTIKKKIAERIYYLLLVLLTFISCLIFNRSTNLIVLILFIEVLHSIVRFLRKYQLEQKY